MTQLLQLERQLPELRYFQAPVLGTLPVLYSQWGKFEPCWYRLDIPPSENEFD